MPRSAYSLLAPETRTTSVTFASPHSGRDYPWSFLGRTVLDAVAMRSSEDAFVDRLFDSAPACGAPLLAAGAPRAFVDLNRAPDELDPALIRGAPRVTTNPRVASGLGVIPRVVAGGRAIYRGKITLAEAEDRIARYWRPYHARLEALMDEAHRMFGEAILIDCHSMPREALDGLAARGAPRPEIVLGDRFGVSSDAEIVERIEAAFASAGFSVARNAPFAGAFVAQHYGRPSRGWHCVQVEIDRSLYMDERTLRPLPGFNAFRARLAAVIAEIADIGRRPRRALAAE